MKKSILLVAFGFAVITANAQKMKEAEVPAPVKVGFTKTYKDVKVKEWVKENGNYEAAFDYNKNEMSVLIDANGNIKETETEIAVSALPKAVSEYAAKNVAGKKIKEASKIVDAKGKVTYEAEIDEADYIFDANGMFIKKEVEAKDEDDKKKD